MKPAEASTRIRSKKSRLDNFSPVLLCILRPDLCVLIFNLATYRSVMCYVQYTHASTLLSRQGRLGTALLYSSVQYCTYISHCKCLSTGDWLYVSTQYAILFYSIIQ